MDLAQVIFNDSITGNQDLGSPANKQNAKVQSFIPFCNAFFWFVQQNKICIIKIIETKPGKYLLNGYFLTEMTRAVFKTQPKV